MLSAWTSPRRTIATAFSFEMCRALNTASTGKSTASSGANSSSALGPGNTVVRRARRRSGTPPALAELGLDAQALRPAPVARHDADARLEEPQHVVLERDEAPLAVVVEDDRPAAGSRRPSPARRGRGTGCGRPATAAWRWTRARSRGSRRAAGRRRARRPARRRAGSRSARAGRRARRALQLAPAVAAPGAHDAAARASSVRAECDSRRAR